MLVPHTTLHDHYLFNRSYTYDGQDYTGLPWNFYYVNVGSNPPADTLRTRCPMQQVDGSPYNHANFGWFRYPAPGMPWVWPRSNGTEPLASTGEYLESSRLDPIADTKAAGFVFDGEFAGETNPPSAHRDGQQPHYFIEAVYFTDRECSDAGTEYGWYRMVANTDSGDAAPNSFTFYYSIFSNCNQDYACWDVNGHQVQGQAATVQITDVATNSRGTYEYKFRILRNGSNFDISILDPGSGAPLTCAWSIAGNGPCEFSVPIASWYPPADQVASGYIVVASQSSHVYPAQTGAAYPQWYDYASGQGGASPPANVVPTKEPNGMQSCITGGKGYACLQALSLDALYQ